MSKRPKLWMLVGMPGSGKSTWVQAQTTENEDDLYVASTDMILESIAIFSGKTYNEVFKDHIKTAEKQMYEGVMRAVNNNHYIIWDQTNLTRKSRAKKLIMIPDHYEKIAVVFPTPESDEWKRRLDSRPGKTIPHHVLETMSGTFEEPASDEGFSTIITVTDDMMYWYE